MPTSLPPSISANAALIKGVPANSGAGGATQVPPGILALPSGTVLRGTISQIDGRGNAILSTAKGDVSLHTDLAIKLGSDVALRLTTSSEGVKARILSINGMSPKEFAEKSTIPRGQQIHVDDIVQTDKGGSQGKAGATNTGSQPPAARNALAPATTATANPATASTAATTDAAGLKPLPLQAVVVSRAEQVATMLKALPPALNLTSQTLQSGTALQVKLLPATVSLPNQGATATASTTAAVTPSSPSGNSAPPSPATPGGTAPNSPAANLSAGASPQASAPATAPIATPQTTTTGAVTTPPPPAPTGNTGQNTTTSPAPTTTAATGANAAPSTAAPPGSQTPSSAPSGTAPSSPAAPGALANTSAATVSGGNTAATSTPSTASTTVPNTAPSTPASAGRTTAPAPAATATPNTNTAPPPGQTTAAAPSTPAAPTSPSALPPLPAPTQAQLQTGIIPAQIIGHEASGHTVVKTALGTMRVTLPGAAQQQNWPTGTQFELQIERPLPQANAANASNASSASAQPASLSELSMQWRSLQEAMDILQQLQPAIAAQIRDQIIPKPGQKMAASMLFFLSALRGGNLRQWLGDKAIDALEQQQRGDLVKKLTTEFGTLRQFFTDSPSPNWQAVFAPVFDEHHWQQARLFLRKEPEGKEGENFGTRFVMELELSRMGPMQLDGLVRKQRRNTQFDLIIRTTTPLAEPHQNEIREIYQNAAEISGFEGRLQFQKTSPFPVLPMRDIIADVPDVLA